MFQIAQRLAASSILHVYPGLPKTSTLQLRFAHPLHLALEVLEPNLKLWKQGIVQVIS